MSFVLWHSILILLHKGAGILFCSNSVRYALAFSSLLLLDRLCIRGRMLSAVSFLLRNSWRWLLEGRKVNKTHIHIFKIPAVDQQSTFCLWDRSHITYIYMPQTRCDRYVSLFSHKKPPNTCSAVWEMVYGLYIEQTQRSFSATTWFCHSAEQLRRPTSIFKATLE